MQAFTGLNYGTSRNDWSSFLYDAMEFAFFGFDGEVSVQWFILGRETIDTTLFHSNRGIFRKLITDYRKYAN